MTVTPFQTEAWTEYAIGVVVLSVRFFARWRMVGFKWQGDDYFAVGALIFWTAELTMLELIGQHGTNIGVTNDVGAKLTPEDIHSLEIGSKCLLAGWCCYVTLIWCLKACMLFFYNRITLGLKQQKAVKWTAGLCVATYIVTISVILGHCRPIQRNWQIYPYPGDKCTLGVPNYLTLVATNMSTDFVICLIPVPLLWKVKLPLRRKLVIGLLLCSGVFIMTATLLRCILSLQNIEFINTSTIWAIRETFVGIIAVNAPCIKPLLSNSKWLSSKSSSNKPSDLPSYGRGNNSYQLGTVKSGKDYMTKRSATHRTMNMSMQKSTAENSSEEFIIMKNNKDPFASSNDDHADSYDHDRKYNEPQTLYHGNAKNEISTSYGASPYRVPSEEDKSGIQVTTTVEVMPSSKLDV